MDEQTKVSRSITRLVISHPFFGSMALSLKIEADEEISTMCTDGKFIKWNHDFVANMSEEETTGVMAHEVMHVGMKHNLRRGDRDPERWNIACDYVINPILIVEVLSKSTESYDRGDKFHKYCSLPSFREYVLIDQYKPVIDILYREDASYWKMITTIGLDKSIYLNTIDAHIALADIYRNTQNLAVPQFKLDL